MSKLIVFNQVSVDGCFVDARGDMSWAKEGADPELDRFTVERAQGGGVLVFGRVTYELMERFWPTGEAARLFPEVARAMNARAKIVFSRTLDEARWANTTLVKRDLEGTIRRMKAGRGPDLTVLGSGTIVAQLAEAGLVDAYELLVCPIVLGGGRSPFEDVRRRLDLTLAGSRAFRNGKVLLRYSPRAS